MKVQKSRLMVLTREQLFLVAFTLISICSLQTAHAGWVSSGGELFSTDSNAWFIQNTKTINYCVSIDEENFGVTLGQAEKQIHLAWAYWKRQINNISLNEEGASFKLATQELVKVDCQAEHDIHFLFGVQPLVTPSTAFEASKTIGRAIRTDYDMKNLKGKGFIYISPEKGAFALDLTLGFFGRNAERRWAINDGLILRGVLIHEIGHVLGIEHHGSTFNEPMSKAFPAYIVSSIATNEFERTNTLYWPDTFPAFITKHRHAGIIKDEYQRENFEKYLLAPKNLKGWEIVSDEHSLILQVSLEDGSSKNIGRLSYVSADTDLQVVGYFYFPDQQEVIESFEPGMNLVKPIPVSKKFRYKFQFIGLNNYRRLIELKVDHNNEGFLVDAISDQTIATIVRRP